MAFIPEISPETYCPMAVVDARLRLVNFPLIRISKYSRALPLSLSLCHQRELCVCDVFNAKVPLTPNSPRRNFPRNFRSLMENLYSIGIQIPRQRQITILGELRLASTHRRMSMFHYARRGIATWQLSKERHRKRDWSWKFPAKRKRLVILGSNVKVIFRIESNFSARSRLAISN